MDEAALTRLLIFGGLFIALAVTELKRPMRPKAQAVRQRWMINLGFGTLNVAALRILSFVLPPLTVVAAFAADTAGVGLLPWLGFHSIVSALLGFAVLDLAVYAQHAAFHRVPFFWRFHRVHHSDMDLDVTSGVRFHTIEILISQVWKLAIVVFLGVPVFAVLVFEIVLSSTSLFNHSNLSLPRTLDGLLRNFIVTPSLHWVHHSTMPAEYNSNFGFNLSVWDRIFGTWHDPKPEGDCEPIGLPSFQDARAHDFAWLLRFPFVRGPVA